MRKISIISLPKIVDQLITTAIITVISILLFILGYFTAPMTDESLPIAIAIRFLQGQKPFIDDLSPYIGLGLLIAPIVKLSMVVHHGKNELILFLRHAYLFFSLCFGLYTYLSTRKYLSNILALSIALSMVIFHPFGINNFHYDTLGTLLWSAILFQLYNFIFNKKNHIIDYVAYALLNVILCLSYPTFLFLTLLINVAAGFYISDRKRFILSQATIYGLGFVILLTLIFLTFGVHYADILNTLEFNKNLAHFSAHKHTLFQKTSIVFINIFKHYAPHILIALALLRIATYYKKSTLIQNLILSITIIIPLFFIQILHPSFTGIFFYLSGFGFTGAIVFLTYLKHDPLTKRIFYSIWIPSFFAGLLTSVSSYNLELNFIIGFFPAVLASVIFYYLCFKNINGNQSYIPKFFIVFFITLLCYFQLSYIYGDDKRGLEIYTSHQQYLVEGPLNHLYVEPKWIPTLTSLQKDLQSLDTSDTSFIYFGPFSVGYLLVDKLKPGDYLAYCSYEIDHYGQKVRTPNYTVDLSKSLNLPPTTITTYLSQLPYKKITTQNAYDIYLLDKF